MIDLLLIVPHPDDEVFGSGGVIRRMTQQGRQVATLTLTRGGAGRTLNLCTREELPAKREQELRNSLSTLGVSPDLTFIWDYPDYVTAADRGMDPRPGLEGEDKDELIDRIRALMQRLRPRSILTFPPNGANGHPDHVVTNQLVMAAVQDLAEGPESVYYFASERPYIGAAPRGFMPAEQLVSLHLPPTHYVQLTWELEAKLRAMGHHETQALSVMTFMRWFSMRLLAESFHRVIPAPIPGVAPETIYWL